MRYDVLNPAIAASNCRNRGVHVLRIKTNDAWRCADVQQLSTRMLFDPRGITIHPLLHELARRFAEATVVGV